MTEVPNSTATLDLIERSRKSAADSRELLDCTDALLDRRSILIARHDELVDEFLATGRRISRNIARIVPRAR